MNWAQEGRKRPHHRYDVWHLAKRLAVEIYSLTEHFPKSEQFGLVSQLRRAAVSVPSNIAEGAARDTDGQFLRFLYEARGSLAEIDTQLEIAGDVGYLADATTETPRQTYDNLSRALQALIDRLEADRDD